jgi:alanine racemase
MNDFFERQPTQNEIYEKIKGYDSWLEINLDAVSHNLTQIRRQTGAEVIPCLKTNAYGHGLVPITAFLMHEGVERVLVAKLWEAKQIRAAKLNCGVINLAPLFVKEDFRMVVREKVTQTVYEDNVAEKLSQTAVELNEKTAVWIKIDTGLGRVGVRYREAPEFINRISKLPGLNVEGVFSTLSEEPGLDKIQVERFKQVDIELKNMGLNPLIRSIASSNAIFHRPYSYFDAVRPGLTLFGLYPEPGDRDHGVDLCQALKFIARVEQVKTVKAGDSLTYSRRFTAPKTMRVGTLHIGYSDGYPRELTNKGVVRVEGKIKPVLGTISVNHMLVDLEETNVKHGDVVEAISPEGENSGEQLASLSGIMPYKLCVGLNPLTPRVFYRNGLPVALSSPRLVDL